MEDSACQAVVDSASSRGQEGLGWGTACGTVRGKNDALETTPSGSVLFLLR